MWNKLESKEVTLRDQSDRGMVFAMLWMGWVFKENVEDKLFSATLKLDNELVLTRSFSSVNGVGGMELAELIQEGQHLLIRKAKEQLLRKIETIEI